MGRMGLIRSKLSASVVGYLSGVAVTAVGAGLQWGLGIGMVVGGVLVAASCLNISEGDESP